MTRTLPSFILATRNPGKAREINALLSAGLPPNPGPVPRIRSLLDFPSIGDIAETGSTLAENAVIKARAVRGHFPGAVTIADDTGLEVDALGGAPGIFSARYAGEDATYDDNCRLLLETMKDEPEERRSARFRCVICCLSDEGEMLFEGLCEGSIATAPRGRNGFGYDPVFIPAGYRSTFAELAEETKNGVSHRGRALRGLSAYLRERFVPGGLPLR